MATNFGFMNILAITSPIFIIIAIGYISVSRNIFPKSSVRSLGLLVINFALPALLFKAASERHISSIFKIEYVLAYGIGSLLAFALIFWIAVKQGKTGEQGAVSGLGSAFSNTGFIGYPIILSYLGEEGLSGVALSMIVENIFLLPLVLAIAENISRRHKKFFPTLAHSLKGVIKNPIVVAISLGVLFSIFEIPTPAPVSKVIGMFAGASSAVALFAIGGVLVGLELKGVVSQISLIAFGKLIIHPLMVFTMIILLPPFDPKLQIVAIVLAAMPMMSIYPILGQKYGEEAKCAAALLLATICSFFTINALIWLLNHYYLPT